MKRYSKFAAILAFAVFALLSSQAYLQTVDNGTPVRPAFVDEDGDGICDNYDGGQRRGLGQGTRTNFVDNDGDGICDNQGTNSLKRLREGNRKGVNNHLGDSEGKGKGFGKNLGK